MSTFHPWQLFVVTLAGWLNRHQQDVIDYLVEENRVLKRQLQGKRLRLTDDERRRLAVKGKALGRRVLEMVSTIVTPDTILAWYRKLVARKWNYSARRKPGRPRTKTEISDLVVRMARDNPTWGYTRIREALAHLGHRISRGTVANILKDNGIEPAFERSKRTPWRTFLKAHWETLAAADFFTVEVAGPRGWSPTTSCSSSNSRLEESTSQELPPPRTPASCSRWREISRTRSTAFFSGSVI